MKRLLAIFLLSVCCNPLSFAAFYDIKDATTSLQALTLDEIPTEDENYKLTDTDMRNQDVAFDTLEKAVKVAINETDTDKLKEEILRVALILLQKDRTQFAGEVILPLYEKDSKNFLKSLQKLPPKDAKIIEEAVKNAARVKKSGNG